MFCYFKLPFGSINKKNYSLKSFLQKNGEAHCRYNNHFSNKYLIWTKNIVKNATIFRYYNFCRVQEKNNILKKYAEIENISTLHMI